MTAFVLEPQPFRRGPSPEAAVAVAIGATVVVLGLFIAGVTFFGLAIAFPIAAPIAEAYHFHVKVADAALAARIADFWWVFAGASIASFVAAGAVAVRAVHFIGGHD